MTQYNITIRFWNFALPFCKKS